MKKKLILLLLILTSVSLVRAQQHDYYLEFFMGFPSGARTYTMEIANSAPGEFNGTVKVVPDMGFFIETQLNSIFSVGFEVSYTSAFVTNQYTYKPPYFPEKLYKEQFDYTLLRLISMWGVHFVNTERLNLFINAGLGFAIKDTKAEYYEHYERMALSGGTIFQNSPLTYRLAFNLRFFPLKKIGFSASAGLSETPFRAGLGMRF